MANDIFNNKVKSICHQCEYFCMLFRYVVVTALVAVAETYQHIVDKKEVMFLLVRKHIILVKRVIHPKINNYNL